MMVVGEGGQGVKETDHKHREGIRSLNKHLWKGPTRTFKYSQSGNWTSENGIWKKTSRERALNPTEDLCGRMVGRMDKWLN